MKFAFVFGEEAVNLREDVIALRRQYAALHEEVRALRAARASDAELRDDAEKLVLRALIRDLVGGKPDIDKFLDVLGDLSPMFRDGPLEGDMDKVMEGGRPQHGDLGEPRLEGTETFSSHGEPYIKRAKEYP